jgi:hypothetical protein
LTELNKEQREFVEIGGELDYHFHRYDRFGMLALHLFGCVIREDDQNQALWSETLSEKNISISEYSRAMVDYGIAFTLTEREPPTEKMLGFIQKWVYDQI